MTFLKAYLLIKNTEASPQQITSHFRVGFTFQTGSLRTSYIYGLWKIVVLSCDTNRSDKDISCKEKVSRQHTNSGIIKWINHQLFY